MKKKLYPLLFTFVFFYNLSSYAQIRFESGYFIDHSGNKTVCLIRNNDWMFNPSSFEYKLDENAVKVKKEIADVKEFGIGNNTKYISAAVQIDTSTDKLDDAAISNTYNPEWKKVQVFLKVLVEGKASLYVYEQQDMIRFFYCHDNSPIEQLVYKKYKTPGDVSFNVNSTYLNQLFMQVNYTKKPLRYFEGMNYSFSVLSNWFVKYNRGATPGASSFVAAKKKGSFSPKIFAGVNHLSYHTGSSLNTSIANIHYDAKKSFTAGAELEFFLPFSENKFSVIFEGSFLSYKSTGTNTSGVKTLLDYNTINISGGIRYNTFITAKTKFLVDLGFNKDTKVQHFRPVAGIGFTQGRFMVAYKYFYAKSLFYPNYQPTTGERFTNMYLAVKFSFL
jgi:hypothetical protein